MVLNDGFMPVLKDDTIALVLFPWGCAKFEQAVHEADHQHSPILVWLEA